jgi:hypothetical protein
MLTCVDGTGVTKSFNASSSMNARSSELRRVHMSCKVGHTVAALPQEPGHFDNSAMMKPGNRLTGRPPRFVRRCSACTISLWQRTCVDIADEVVMSMHVSATMAAQHTRICTRICAPLQVTLVTVLRSLKFYADALCTCAESNAMKMGQL